MSNLHNDALIENLAEEVRSEHPDISDDDLEKEVNRRMDALGEPDLKAIAEEEGEWD
jgi:hypothetical protein